MLRRLTSVFASLTAFLITPGLLVGQSIEIGQYNDLSISHVAFSGLTGAVVDTSDGVTTFRLSSRIKFDGEFRSIRMLIEIKPSEDLVRKDSTSKLVRLFLKPDCAESDCISFIDAANKLSMSSKFSGFYDDHFELGTVDSGFSKVLEQHFEILLPSKNSNRSFEFFRMKDTSTYNIKFNL